ncbi:MAG: Undecaprenyl phosphate-alpha-4-amino-4-deoxy-L-arabinose arabinosyl transferase [Syntrophorhabdus sp. PtaU1.Bin058]|nr:MAG: Undecaprenyl phosphate-alpha-4-amino-4-deoxy-L-arabinose arabinosyl transferase [Syntrophorhabdus sp. PtaU1.Bin058]
MTYLKTETFKHLILLLIVAVPLFSLGISNHGLWSADEPRVAEIGREMALTGNWAVPTLNRKPFLEEPPLYYGALALTFKAFGGACDKIARFPSALFSFATVLVLFFLANSIFGPRVALLSGLILATSGEYFRVSHWIVVDSALTFFVVSTLALFITGYLSDSSRKKFLCYTLAYVASTLAFYAKGFIGIVIPGLSILAFLCFERNLKEILRMRLWLGILIFLGMTLPWFMALWRQAGAEYFKIFFLHNHLQRFLPASMAGQISGAASGHHHPFYYYVTEFPGGFLPWSILLIPVLFHAFSRTGLPSDPGSPQAKGRLFAKCWFLAGIIFLSVASTKRTLYLMPIFAPISLLTATYSDFTLSSGTVDRMGKVFLWVFDVLLIVVGAALIPAYFYLKEVYLQTLPASLLASVIPVSMLILALALAGAFYLRRGSLKPYWVSVNISVVVALLFTLTAIVPILDKHKSFVPFCDQVTATVPAERQLYAYRPDETLRGAVPFYTGRFVIEEEKINGALFSEEKPFYLIIRDRREAMEKELLSTGKLNVLVKQLMGSDRALVLFTNMPVARTVTIGDAFKKAGKIRTPNYHRQS